MTRPHNGYVEQIGGSHYGNKYGHWDYCKDAGTGYFEASATKYIYRWRSKAGVIDLKKAKSFVEKLLVGNEYTNNNRGQKEHDHLLQRFLVENDVPSLERYVIQEVINWETGSDLEDAIAELEDMIKIAEEQEPTKQYVNQG